MRWRDAVAPARMERVAIVAPATCVTPCCAAVADAGVVELERDRDPVAGPAHSAWERLRRHAGQAGAVVPVLGAEDVDPAVLESAGDSAALAGEAELEEVRQAAVDDERGRRVRRLEPGGRGRCPGRAGRRRSAAASSGCRCPARRAAADPSAALPGSAFQPLVDTYATVPYRDVNPVARSPAWPTS